TNPFEIEALIERVEGGEMRAGDAQLIGRLLRLALALLRVLEGKNASLARLKRLLFGPKSERRMKEVQEPQADPHAVTCSQSAQNEGVDEEPRPEAEQSASRSSIEPAAERERQTRPGHGRLGANAYSGAKTVRRTDPTLQPGDCCPHQLCPGHLY